MTSNVDITNRALAQIGTRSQITALDNTTTEGQYALLLYSPLRDFLLREGDYDFSMEFLEAGTSTAATPPWIYSYDYPTNALRIRGVIPSVYVPFDPAPIEFNVVTTAGARRIYTNTLISSFLCTVAVAEDLWDPLFTEAFTRLLASALAFALENRIEASKEKLEEAINFAGIADLRDG